MRAPFELPLMPFAVRLRDMGQRKLGTGEPADVLRVQVAEHVRVDGPPPGAWELYVHQRTHRIAQWSWFQDADDESPASHGRWSDWQRHGDVWIANEHGPGRDYADVVLHDERPASLDAP